MIEARLDVRDEFAHGRGEDLPHELASWAVESAALGAAALDAVARSPGNAA